MPGLKERGSLFRHLALVAGVLLIIAIPDPTFITDFVGAMVVARALRPRLGRLFPGLGPCRCDYHHYGACQCQGFPYLQVWSGIPAPLRVRVEPRGRGNLSQTGLFHLSEPRARERWDRTVTFRGQPSF